MFHSSINRFFGGTLVLALLIAMGSVAVRAQQTFPRAGRSFSFGVIEGPDDLLGDSAQQQTTLQLSVVSMYSGCGVIVSPSGYFLDFSFVPGTPTLIDLPYYLMQRFDLGKTNKGILVHTSEPVNLMLEDYVLQAGDGTQIYPDDALDTNYLTFGWGIYDDPGERNIMEFLVTATEDSTLVTITPTVNTLDGGTAGVPFEVRLDRGDCYIAKADISGAPADPSLSGSTIVSTKPVSVIAGLTCAYVPLGYESCQEIMDELVGKKWWGSHFFVEPMGNDDSGVVMVFTGDRPFFAKINNGFSSSTGNRIVATFTGPAEIHTFDNNGPVRVEAHQLARGSDFSQTGVSDPTLVTVLDTAYYADTLIWNTPNLGSFQNWVPIIYPTNALSGITLDNAPLSSTGAVSSVINGSEYSAINPSLYPGFHSLISPEPLFAIGSGFGLADAYSFLPGTAGSKLPPDTAVHKILLTADSGGRVCSEFGVSAALVPPIVPDSTVKPENVMSLTIPISYDPAVMHFLRVEPHAVLLNQAMYSVDSSTPGIIIISIAGVPFLGGSDLFRVVFEGRASTAATPVGNNSTGLFGCGDATESLSILPTALAIQAATDTLRRTFALSNSPATICTPLTVALTSDSVLHAADGFALASIEVTFDTAAQQLVNTSAGEVLNGIPFKESDAAIGDYRLILNTPATLAGGDTLLLLQFVPDASATSATLHATLTYIRCYDTLTRNVTLTYPISPLEDTTSTALSILTSTVSLGNQALVDILLSGLPASAEVHAFDLYLTYNHDVVSYDQANPVGTITANWPTPQIHRGEETDTLHFASPILTLASSGILAHLLFTTYVADSASTPIEVTSSLQGISGGCPIFYIAPLSITAFDGRDLCGDSVLRYFMQQGRITLKIARIESGNLHVVIQSPSNADVTLTLTDVLGRIVWQGTLACGDGTTTHDFPLPASLPSGQLTLSLTSERNVISRQLLLVK